VEILEQHHRSGDEQRKDEKAAAATHTRELTTARPKLQCADAMEAVPVNSPKHPTAQNSVALLAMQSFQQMADLGPNLPKLLAMDGRKFFQNLFAALREAYQNLASIF
jgi:hypothetical protein